MNQKYDYLLTGTFDGIKFHQLMNRLKELKDILDPETNKGFSNEDISSARQEFHDLKFLADKCFKRTRSSKLKLIK